MANEVKVQGPGTGLTCYFRILNNTSGFVWNTSGGVGAYELFNALNVANYGIQLTELGGSNLYAGNIPAAVPPGTLDIDARQQIGGSQSVNDPFVGGGEVEWNGTRQLPRSDNASSGLVSQFLPARIYRGEMIPNMKIYLKSSADHVTPFISGNGISGQISRDNMTTFTTLQSGGMITEIGQGVYNLTLTSGDTLANTFMLLINGTDVNGGTCDPLPLSFVTQRTSGQG